MKVHGEFSRRTAGYLLTPQTNKFKKWKTDTSTWFSRKKTDTSKFVSDTNTKRKTKWNNFTKSIKSGWTSTKNRLKRFRNTLVS